MLTHAIQSDIVMICARVMHEKMIRKGLLSFIHNVMPFVVVNLVMTFLKHIVHTFVVQSFA